MAELSDGGMGGGNYHWLIVVFAVLLFFAVTQDGTSDTDIVERMEGVGWSRDLTMRCFDQYERNGGYIERGLGWDRVNGSSASRSNWTFNTNVVEEGEGVVKGREEVGQSDI